MGWRRRSLAVSFFAFAAMAASCSDAGDDASPLARATRPPPPSTSVKAKVTGTGGSGLRVRQKPTTSSTQLGTLAEGETVTIACQIQGETINGNDVWNLLDEEGGYVSDAYLDGPRGFAKGAPRCDGGATTKPPPDAGTGGGAGGTVDIEGPAVQPHVQFFADEACKLQQACRASTYVGHSPSADLALDLPTSEDYGKLPTDNHAFGDRLAEFAVANRAKYRIDYVIYRQRINSGTGWRTMEDRGSITQNHFDHVHVSFDP
ncbi:MAG: SH3 domain-containing protein [Deltaproteobacteria bacterium]|nr:SH3 domain-containing protein [Deltaproteobacteria bacterium]